MAARNYVVDFPTLWVLAAWHERHCVIPDGFRKGTAWQHYDWQLWITANHYRIKPDAVAFDDEGYPTRAAAFANRRSQVVAAQKALALDTPVATPGGWSTMGDLRVGDEVFDESGRPTRVLSKSQVWESTTYRVTFSDGASLVACGDHQWWVERRTRKGYLPERISTSELVDNLIDEGGARRFRVPNAKPLQLPEVDLPVPPYTLGAWLGDGETNGQRVTGIDEGVFDLIKADGFEVRQDQKIPKRRSVIGIRAGLRAAGVLGNKHIPAAYLRASVEQRWALLRGLMDTDGYADQRQGKCEFTTTLPALRDGFIELLNTLGIKSTCYEGVATLYGRETGPKWRINFAARADQPVFGLERKQSRLKPAGGAHAQYGHRRIVSVEKIETVPTQCITVDAPSHVFLAGREMIPTCNTGKGPFAAVIVCGEAVGPALFAGWAEDGDVYVCEEHGCGCGWSYPYEPGEAMGMPWPTPLIQLLATSEDQVDNVYRPLQAMARGPYLSELMQVREGFIRLPNDGRIDVVTSSAQSRLGNPITFALQDETQLYTQTNKLVKVAETMRRGLAGMGGRSMETTNAWDPAEQSVAQRTFEAKAKDVFKFFESPPTDLKWSRRDDRLKILAFNYEGSPHVPVAQVLAEAEELAETDPAQAERFYGNRIVAGLGSWLDGDAWDARKADVPTFARKTQVVLGFDGSDSDDWTGIRAETRDGFQFTPVTSGGPTIWNPADYGGKVPRLDVAAAVEELFETFDVVRMYCDPPYWSTEIDAWAEQFGKERVIRWETYQPKRMHAAAERLVTDVNKRDSGFSHDGCEVTATHVRNARRAARNPAPRYVLTKPGDGRKIDLAVCSILAHEAAGDVTAAKLWRRKSYTYIA